MYKTNQLKLHHFINPNNNEGRLGKKLTRENHSELSDWLTAKNTENIIVSKKSVNFCVVKTYRTPKSSLWTLKRDVSMLKLLFKAYSESLDLDVMGTFLLKYISEK